MPFSLTYSCSDLRLADRGRPAGTPTATGGAMPTACEAQAATREATLSHRGVALIEVLVASVLLGIGVVGLLSVATLAMRNQQRTEYRATALCLAQEKLAEVELVGPYVWTQGHPTRGTQNRGGSVYNWIIEVERLAVGELFSVRVETGWSGPGGGGTVELEMWLNDYAAEETLELEPRERPSVSSVALPFVGGAG